MKKIFFLATILLAVTACQQATDTQKEKVDTATAQAPPPIDTVTAAAPPAATTSWTGILKMSDADFTSKMASSQGLTIVDYSATWCGPCKQLHPILESLAKKMEGKVNFGNVDVDESPKLASELGISSIPLLVFYKNGKIVDKLIGLLPEAELVAKINEHL